MSSQNKKKIIFGFLLLVLIYIWGNNLGWLSHKDIMRRVSEGSSDIPTDTKPTAYLNYSPPRINPFLDRGMESQDQKAVTDIVKKSTLSTPPKPSGAYVYVGFIDRPHHSQAVLSGHDKATVILELGDSLSDWKLGEFTPSMAIFQFDKVSDTLQLTK